MNHVFVQITVCVYIYMYSSYHIQTWLILSTHPCHGLAPTPRWRPVSPPDQYTGPGFPPASVALEDHCQRKVQLSPATLVLHHPWFYRQSKI